LTTYRKSYMGFSKNLLLDPLVISGCCHLVNLLSWFQSHAMWHDHDIDFTRLHCTLQCRMWRSQGVTFTANWQNYWSRLSVI